MPELPEAETIVRGLRPRITGRTVSDVRVVHADLIPGDPAPFAAALEGRTIEAVRRRGKNVVFVLDDGSVLLINLGMTGKLVPDPSRSGAGAPTHPGVVLEMDDGGRLVYDDVRRFGRVEVLSAEAWAERSDSLGPEPLDSAFLPAHLSRAIRASRSPIRNLLLDQKRVAGVGNIYASEALHRACLHPCRPGRSLEDAEVEALHASLRALLAEAIQAGGTTIRDYRDATGAAGRYATELRVYDREGEACGRCGATVLRIVLTNRSAFFCPECQPEP